MRRVLTILVILAITIGGSLYGYELFAQEREPAAPDFDTVAVERCRLCLP